MANPLPNEGELYDRIKRERIRIASEIWDLLYNRIGDDVTAINLICSFYAASGEAVPLIEARKILQHTRHIKDIVNKLTVASTVDLFFPEFTGDMPLHSVVREMLTHYIGNDVYAITLVVGDAVDPAAPTDLSLEYARKVLAHAHSIRTFMERLREATA